MGRSGFSKPLANWKDKVLLVQKCALPLIQGVNPPQRSTKEYMSPDQESPGADVIRSELEWDKPTAWWRSGVQEEEGMVGLAHVGSKHHRSQNNSEHGLHKDLESKEADTSSGSHTGNSSITECPPWACQVVLTPSRNADNQTRPCSLHSMKKQVSQKVQQKAMQSVMSFLTPLSISQGISCLRAGSQLLRVSLQWQITWALLSCYLGSHSFSKLSLFQFPNHNLPVSCLVLSWQRQSGN